MNPRVSVAVKRWQSAGRAAADKRRLIRAGATRDDTRARDGRGHAVAARRAKRTHSTACRALERTDDHGRGAQPGRAGEAVDVARRTGGRAATPRLHSAG